MQIFPQDLGEKWNALVIRQRAVPAGMVRGPGRFLADRRLGALGRLWTRGQVADEKRAEILAQAAAPPLFGVTFLGAYLSFMASLITLAAGSEGHFPTASILVLVAGFWTLGGTVSVAGSRALFRKYHQKALKPEEVDALLEGCDEEIHRAFLSLVRDATRQSAPPETEANIRTALQALDAAIGRLPAVQFSVLDALALRAEAAALLEQSRTEPDRVTAESMERRARAIEHRVAANERSALLARRSTALRAEILAQIEALREGIAALNTRAPDFSGLAYLAQTARQVASEAGELAGAREELESSLAGLPRPTGIEEPLAVHAGESVRV